MKKCWESLERGLSNEQVGGFVVKLKTTPYYFFDRLAVSDGKRICRNSFKCFRFNIPFMTVAFMAFDPYIT